MLKQSTAEGLIKINKFFVDRSPLILNRPTNIKRQLVTGASGEQETFYLNITQTAVEFGEYSTTTGIFQSH